MCRSERRVWRAHVTKAQYHKVRHSFILHCILWVVEILIKEFSFEYSNACSNAQTKPTFSLAHTAMVIIIIIIIVKTLEANRLCYFHIFFFSFICAITCQLIGFIFIVYNYRKDTHADSYAHKRERGRERKREKSHFPSKMHTFFLPQSIFIK